ncbi:three-helix bundle dimerization domain-containing protein [Sinomonas sp. B1-1]|uniref:three-helix bundle dimerization domain-containing protein n=1 Tax=Sinomonas sp. B1-1 TaxID=3141454 RepID=UPI003D28D18A
MEQSEAQALAGVRARLSAQFPDVGEDSVAEAVAAAHAEMTGPVRDYVPVLVERTARDRLVKRLGHPPRPTPTGALPRP